MTSTDMTFEAKADIDEDVPQRAEQGGLNTMLETATTRQSEKAVDAAAGSPMTLKRIVLMTLGFISFGAGVVGIFVPLLPTTEFIVLSAFLFAKSSPRFHNWVLNTKVYRGYVEPFLGKKGASMKVKTRIALSSAIVLLVSAILMKRWYVYLILGCLMAAILYVVFVRVPTSEE